MRQVISDYLKFYSACAALLLIGSCGDGSSSGIWLNEPEPRGTIVAQGTFSGLNGKTASGNAIVYKQGEGSYVLRLSNASLPEEAGLKLILVVNSVSQSGILLRSSSGNQNYNFTLSYTSPTFNSVRLNSVLAFRDYASALFIQ
jgi:hypothetical protein